MKQAYSGYWLSLAVTAVLLAGCDPRVNYVVKNGGTQTLHNITFTSESGVVFEHGILTKGAHSSFSGAMKLKKETLLMIY